MRCLRDAQVTDVEHEQKGEKIGVFLGRKGIARWGVRRLECVQYMHIIAITASRNWYTR